MTGFASVDLFYTLTNLAQIALIVAIVACGIVFCWLCIADYYRQRDLERRQPHPSASNVTVIRPPRDWETEGWA